MSVDERYDPRWYLVPVVEWTGPDGRVRSGVPRGVEEARPVPAVGASMAISYDPQDPDWFAVPGSVTRGRGWTAGGMVAIAAGLVLAVPSGLVTGFLLWVSLSP